MRNEELITALRSRFSDDLNENFDVLDFVWRHGSVVEALMYARLFWPELAEIEGMVIVKDRIDTGESRARLRDAIGKMRDSSAVEESFNLHELPDDLFSKTQDATDEQVDFLAERLQEMWRARLQSLYPNKHFVVKILPPAETGYSVGITFYQERTNQ